MLLEHINIASAKQDHPKEAFIITASRSFGRFVVPPPQGSSIPCPRVDYGSLPVRHLMLVL